MNRLPAFKTVTDAEGFQGFTVGGLAGKRCSPFLPSTLKFHFSPPLKELK
jgi:hypothetical protein